MKYQHAQHVIHQQNILVGEILALETVKHKLNCEAAEAAKVPEELVALKQDTVDNMAEIDREIAELLAEKESEVKKLASIEARLKDVPDPVKTDKVEREIERLSLKKKRFDAELDEARKVVAEVAEREKAFKEAQARSKDEIAKKIVESGDELPEGFTPELAADEIVRAAADTMKKRARRNAVVKELRERYSSVVLDTMGNKKKEF